MYLIITLNQELSTAKLYLLDERNVFDRHICHTAALLGEFVEEDHTSFLRHTGYLNIIKDHKCHVLLLILVHVLLLSCHYFAFLSHSRRLNIIYFVK